MPLQESLLIRNFGPIQEVELSDIRPFTVIIGPSGKGKSTILKVLVLFRWFYKMECIRAYLRLSKMETPAPIQDYREYLTGDGLGDFVRTETEIVYRRGKVRISADGRQLQLQISSTDDPEELHLEKLSFIADSRIAISDVAARGTQNLGFYLNETLRDFDLAMKELESYAPSYFSGVKMERIKSPIGVRYRLEEKAEGQDEGTRQYHLENASSGMQTTLPMMAVCRYFATRFNLTHTFNMAIISHAAHTDSLAGFSPVINIGDIRSRRICLHIEEPELSLSPEKQRQVLNEMIATCFSERKTKADYDMSITIATHSPYIVNQLNLLIKAADKNQKVDGAALPYDDVEVYRLNAKGQLYSLKAHNKHYIDTMSLSDDINKIYDAYDEMG